MEPSIIELLKQLSWPGAFGLAVWALRPVWSALGEWIAKKASGPVAAISTTLEQRLNELEGFKLTAESNHFHDLDELKKDRRDVWAAINAIRRDFNKYQLASERRITRLEASKGREGVTV